MKSCAAAPITPPRCAGSPAAMGSNAPWIAPPVTPRGHRHPAPPASGAVLCSSGKVGAWSSTPRRTSSTIRKPSMAPGLLPRGSWRNSSNVWCGGGIHPAALITHRFPLDRVADAYALMASGNCGKVAVCFDEELLSAGQLSRLLESLPRLLLFAPCQRRGARQLQKQLVRGSRIFVAPLLFGHLAP